MGTFGDGLGSQQMHYSPSKESNYNPTSSLNKIESMQYANLSQNMQIIMLQLEKMGQVR